MDRVTDIAAQSMEVGMEAVGDLVDIVRLSSEDLDMQLQPMILLKMFNSYIRPHFERLWKTAKEKIKQKNSNAKLMINSCGNIRPFIPIWIEMGLDILDRIQPQAKGMEPEGLKRDFGNEVYEIIDLGVDVPVEKFVATTKHYQPDILVMSALLTTTMTSMQTTLAALISAGLRDKIKVIMGAARVTETHAKQIEADGFSPMPDARLSWLNQY